MVPSTCPTKRISGGQGEEGHGVVHHVHCTYSAHSSSSDRDPPLDEKTRPRVDKVKPKVWFDNGATGEIDDVLTASVLPLGVHLRFFCWISRGDHSKMFLLFEFCCGTPRSC